MDKDDCINFYAIGKESGEEVKVGENDIFIEHLGYIIDEIPETSTTSDVTIPR